MQTKTKETEENYLSRGMLFCKKIAKAKNIKEELVTADMLLNFFLENQQTYAKATFRQYKASLLYYLEYHKLDGYEEVSSYLKKLTADDCEKNTRKTSNLKRKQVTDEQFDGLLYALFCVPSIWQRLTISWLQFGSMTGLRPCEWQNADLICQDAIWVLRVKNGKNTNERSHGLYRHIYLDDMSDFNIVHLKDFIRTIRSYFESHGYKSVYEGCKQYLHSVNTKLIKGEMSKFGFADKTGSGIYRQDKNPLRITLYSARHIFSSRTKTYLDRISVAALMGHKTNKTAFEHYGRSHKMYSPKGKVRPDNKEVQRIKVDNSKQEWYQQAKLKEQVAARKNNTPTPQQAPSFSR